MTTPARAAIVDALATIDGLTPTPAAPDSPQAGCAWPVWVEARYRDGKLARPLGRTFDVLVVLPASYHPDTVDAGDGLLDAVGAALSTVGSVDVIEPRTIVFEQNQSTMPGLSARVTVATC